MININELDFHYKRGQLLFNSLDLQLESGNIYGLLGRNGAGKTTLLKLISGLLFPKRGSVKTLGYESEERNANMLQDLFYIQEEIYLPQLSVRSFQTIYSPFYPHFNEDRFYELISEFELNPEMKTDGMSYGQKKKVILSFGIASNSKVLVFDEPTNGLDIPSKAQFRKLLASSITDDRLFLVSTHQVRDMNNLIDPIIILEQGKIVFNQDAYSISQALSFENSYGSSEPQDALFSERIPGGYQVVRENLGGGESEIDLEALFNTVVLNKERVKEIFRESKSLV